MEFVNEEQINLVRDYLDANGIRYQSDVNLKKYSCFKSGGVVKLIISPDAVAILQDVVRTLNEYTVKYKTIGSTANILFLDDLTYGVFISLGRFDDLVYERKNKTIEVGAGLELSEFTRQMLVRSITGFEGLEGIPGKIGGAVFMNAGAYGYETGSNLLKVDVVTPEGGLITLEKKDLSFSYRQSAFRKKNIGIICKAYFRAEESDQHGIYQKMELYHAKRHKYQDFLYPNLGSLFSTAPKSIYDRLADNDRMYKLLLYFVKKCYSRKIHRETPMNKRFMNRFTVRYFKFKYDKQPFSDKTLNCIVNNNTSTAELLKFIDAMQDLLGPDVPIENEILRDCIYTGS